MVTSRVLITLQQEARNAMDWLAQDYKAVAWLDFPDYSNVGDSAIWLGQSAWAEDRQHRIIASFPQRAASRRSLRWLAENPKTLAFINGGGNFGDVWESHFHHRRLVFDALRNSPVVQGAQSVWFDDPKNMKAFVEQMGKMSSFRMLARDNDSYALMKGVVPTRLAPDAVHSLGLLHGPAPVQKYVVLARTDSEMGEGGNVTAGVDWLHEEKAGRRFRQTLASVAAMSGEHRLIGRIDYHKAAQRRLARGITILSAGETVVTDRLHGMLLGLLLGRNVVAVDNKLQKLSRYADAWLSACTDKLTFAPNLSVARDIAEG